MFLWIFAAAILFSAVFDGLGAVHAVENMLTSVGGNRWGILIIMQLSFFLMGTVLDDTALLLIVAPLYIPIAKSLGFDLVWYGVLYTVNMQMAVITPPFGYSLFIMKGIAPKQITMRDIYRSVAPFVGIQALCLGVIMVFPQIALYIPTAWAGR
jgi:TRAP-type mannitol/chloroaromatic compound transport system permease large subunit